MSMSALNMGTDSSKTADADYGLAYIGAPTNMHHSSSLGTDPAGRYLKPKTFSGSFIAINPTDSGGPTFHTAESASVSGSEIFGNATSSNTFIPGGEYTAKWISGSFNSSYASTLAVTLFTSSAVTTQDLVNMSSSVFEGSICVATGGFHTGKTRFQSTEEKQATAIFNGGKHLDATMQVCAFGEGMYGGEFFNSGSLSEDNNTGALVLGIVNGTIFAIAQSGSETLVSGSIESFSGSSFINRGPKNPYIDGAVQQNYFAQKRVVRVVGSVDKFQKEAKKKQRTSNFIPR